MLSVTVLTVVLKVDGHPLPVTFMVSLVKEYCFLMLVCESGLLVRGSVKLLTSVAGLLQGKIENIEGVE